jgi:hypothetical protein
MTKIQLITEQSALGKAINANAKSAKKVDETWQVLALSAIAVFGGDGTEECKGTGNVFYINLVYKSLGKGARHQAMTGWLLAFGGVKANTGENKAETPFIKDANKKVDFEKASATPWYEFAPSKKPDEVLDYFSLLMKVVKRSAKEDQTVKGGELRSEVAALLKKYAEEHGESAEGIPSVTSEGDDESEPALM